MRKADGQQCVERPRPLETSWSITSLSPSWPYAPVRISRRSQFAFSSDPLIGFILCFDPIFRLRQETHDREVDIGGARAERWDIPHQLTKAKFVRHVSRFPIVLARSLRRGIHASRPGIDIGSLLRRVDLEAECFSPWLKGFSPASSA